METINGFAVIAETKFSGGTRDILAARKHDRFPNGFEYVVAGCEIGPVTSWYQGHYFTDLADAVRYFESR